MKEAIYSLLPIMDCYRIVNHAMKICQSHYKELQNKKLNGLLQTIIDSHKILKYDDYSVSNKDSPKEINLQFSSLFLTENYIKKKCSSSLELS